jgi:hypothetical protein
MSSACWSPTRVRPPNNSLYLTAAAVSVCGVQGLTLDWADPYL